MASGTGNLPYPGKSYTPFDILTAEELNEDVANIESLATGAGIGDGAIGASKIDFTTLNFGNYSTTEKDTGFKWHNGKTIYKITNIFDRGTGTTYSHTLPTGTEDVVSVNAIARNNTSAGANFVPFPYAGGTAGASVSHWRNSATTMRFDVGTDFAATYRYVVATFLYTKA